MGDEPPMCLEIGPGCSVENSLYGYYPNRVLNGFLSVTFGILVLAQGWQTFKYKTYTYGIAMILGCLAESVGYVGRVLLHDNPFSVVGFQMQICALIIAPAFLSAAIYLTLKHLVISLGPDLSILKPKLYTWIFIGVDILSLTLQGLGGGIAATAEDDMDQQDTGTNVMIAGIVFQVFTLTVFGALVGHFFWRLKAEPTHGANPTAKRLWSSRKFKVFLITTTVAFTCIYVRCVYRIVEMVGGWANEIMRDEISFVILEGFMCLIAAMLLTQFHAGDCFPQMRGDYKSLKYSSSLPMTQDDASYVALHAQPQHAHAQPLMHQQGP